MSNHETVDSFLDELAQVLEQQRDAELERVARALGMSVRTLQRRLRESGTWFVRERVKARVRYAQRRMVTNPVMPLSLVAFDAGFSSPAQLTAAFQKVERTTPSAWRRAFLAEAAKT